MADVERIEGTLDFYAHVTLVGGRRFAAGDWSIEIAFSCAITLPDGRTIGCDRKRVVLLGLEEDGA